VREREQNGFTLIEVLVAAGLMATLALGVAPLFAIAADRNRGAGLQTLATLFARQKVEEIKGRDPSGLARSPAGSLDSDTDGHFDYLDARGVPMGRADSSTPSAGGAAFVRRWAIAPLSAGPAGVIVIQVLVAPAGSASPGAGGWRLHGARVVAAVRERP
jgi:prepilin-type N-terminal cleavage/methylation domain-containing protein